jgi:hypothetical protein
MPTAWQQLSGLTLMTQMPSMDEALSPSQGMQFGNTMVAPAENGNNIVIFDDTSDTPNFIGQPVQDFNDNHWGNPLRKHMGYHDQRIPLP